MGVPDRFTFKVMDPFFKNEQHFFCLRMCLSFFSFFAVSLCFRPLFLQTEDAKSTGSPINNHFTVIKRLKSLKGVRLLMSCDILGSSANPDVYNCHCVLTVCRMKAARKD